MERKYSSPDYPRYRIPMRTCICNFGHEAKAELLQVELGWNHELNALVP
ncbi:hypothetical protein [Paenibacillus sp.]|nr:hypothetical protein [Paenibacillus sp.]